MKKLLLLTGLFLFVTGGTTAQAAVMNEGETNIVQLTMGYRVKANDDARHIRLTVLIPKSIDRRQDVLGIDYSLPPARIRDVGDNRYADFDIDRPPHDFDIRITATVALHRYDLSTALSGGKLTDAAQGTALEPFLKEERYLEKDYPEINTVAGSLRGETDLATAQKIFAWVKARLRYAGYVSEDVGAEGVLRRGTGDCSDFSDLFVTLCRAENIPARPVDGYFLDYGNDTPHHTWTEIYLRDYGWVPVDPLLGSLGKAAFDRLHPEYVYLSDLRNDPELNGYHFYNCTYRGGSVSIKDSFSVVKKP